MAKRVAGFLANDGSFHETEAEADFRDAEEEIRAYCVTHTINDNVFIDVIEALADPVYRYLNAKDRIDVEATRKEVNGLTSQEQSTGNGGLDHAVRDYLATQSTVESDQADDEGTEDRLTSLLEQPTDGHEPMPDVGSGPSAESVLEQREGDGSRSRKRHARGIRGGSALAIDDEAGS